MTAPYYADEHVTLYLGDAREELRWLDADVLVTDPPYGMRWQSGFRKGEKFARIAGDETIEVRDAALALWGGRAALVFGTWRAAPPRGERQRLIWWKDAGPGMGDLRMPWGNSHEEIHVLGSGWDRAGTGIRRQGSVIRTTSGKGGGTDAENAFNHPTPKPVALMEVLISRCPLGVIADPFAGVGATLIAARNLGRRAIGVEIDERHCETIVRRLSQQAFDFGDWDGGAA